MSVYVCVTSVSVYVRVMYTWFRYHVICTCLCTLQCVAVFCSLLQCVAVCCSVLQCVAEGSNDDVYMGWSSCHMYVSVHICQYHCNFSCQKRNALEVTLDATFPRTASFPPPKKMALSASLTCEKRICLTSNKKTERMVSWPFEKKN